MRANILVALMVGLFTGCTHTQLQFNTVHQAETINDIYRQQVLDNLAMFVENPYAVPHFAFPNQGSAKVTDGGVLNGSVDAFRETLGFDVRRTMEEAWTLEPVRDSEKLRRMRCAYQRAVGAEHCDPCQDCCAIEKAFHGNGFQKIKVLDGSTGCPCNTGDFGPIDPLTGMPFVDASGTIGIDPRTNESYRIDARGCVEIPKYDCNGPCSVKSGWFCVGRKCDVPRDCRPYCGNYCGTYVWVLPEYRHELGKLVLLILDYAIYDAPAPRTKAVELYVDANGNTTTQGAAHGKVTALIPIGEENRSILAVADCDEKSTKPTQKELAILKLELDQQLSSAQESLQELIRLEQKVLKRTEGKLLDANDAAVLQDIRTQQTQLQLEISRIERASAGIATKSHSAPSEPPAAPSPTPKRRTDLLLGPTLLRERLFLDALAPQ